MDWPSILAVGIAGGLAAAIASLLIRRSKQRRALYLVVLVILFFGLKFLAEQTILPRVRRWQADRQLRALPFYRDIADVDTQMYAKIVAVAMDSLQKGGGTDAIASRISPIVADSLPKYVGAASDESVIALIDAVTLTVEDLHSKHSDACYYLLFPKENGAPPASSHSDPTSRAPLDAMGLIVHSATHTPQPLPDARKAQSLLVPVVARLRGNYGNDFQLLQQKPVDSAGRQKVCDMTIALYRDIESLPKVDAGLLLRYLLSDQGSQANP